VSKTFKNLGAALALAWAVTMIYSTTAIGQSGITEAPAAFDNLTNGFVDQAEFDDARAEFEEIEAAATGLGPVFNADSCVACHTNPVVGAISQITELRAGHFTGSIFVDQVGGSLINDRAIDASIQERVLGGSEVRTFRTSLNVLGDGFVEAIDSNTLVAIANGQPAGLRGTFIQVPVNEANGAVRGGRFGWKNQHASLESFSADAYLNEMGITSPLFPDENTSAGRNVGFGTGFDPVPEPEDEGEDVEAFANFMRSTKAPSRGRITRAVQEGETLFNQVGCNGCHVSTLRTARAGTLINGGAMRVPFALGNKIFHPYSDFLSHDIGTGDGIPVLPGPEYANTRNLMRTAPLWALRTRNRLMHDGLSFTKQEAIQRHANQGAGARDRYNALTDQQKSLVLTFLDSL